MPRKTKAQLLQEIEDLKAQLIPTPTNFIQRIRDLGSASTSGLSDVAKARLWWDSVAAVDEVFGGNTIVLPGAILPFFIPAGHEKLQALPVLISESVRTGAAITRREDPNGRRMILSPSFWAFMPQFQRDLLVHEFLHILEAESGLDINQFYIDVQDWYNSGEPISENYVKQTLYHYLYSPTVAPEHVSRIPGVEEYAFIGKLLAQDARSHDAVPANIRAYYNGILADEIWQ